MKELLEDLQLYLTVAVESGESNNFIFSSSSGSNANIIKSCSTLRNTSENVFMEAKRASYAIQEDPDLRIITKVIFVSLSCS